MPTFEYTARNAQNQLLKGTLEAKDKDDAAKQLKNKKLILVSLNAPAKQLKLSFGGSGVPTRDVVIFTRQFSTMINAGLPLVQSLTVLAEQTENKVLGETTRAVVYDVESGATLADAFGKHPKVFSELYVNMVAAGEAGGILDTILGRLAVFLEKNDALVRKVKGAMVYPGVIFSVAAIAISVLLIFVIPVFERMFASVNLELPLPTKIVVNMSRFLTGYWWAILLVGGAAAFLFKQWVATPSGKKQFDIFLLKM
ncbi:MAG TPA: type II secretion system F family protein, partial [Gemmatimonadales bacterium]|nr:type II secretion system F family protein [Gemmatimonadales bacterium]